MKIKLISAAAALVALSGSAFALDPATATAAGTAKVYAAGATALRAVVGGLFTQNCDAATLDVYYSAVNGNFPGDTAVGDSHRVYSCTLRSEATLDPEFQGKGLGGKNVTFYKVDRGGSAQGVQPLASPVDVGTAIPVLNLLDCGTRAATVPNYTCNTTAAVAQVPLLGVSDVEPTMFVGENVPAGFNAGGLSAAEVATLTVTPGGADRVRCGGEHPSARRAAGRPDPGGGRQHRPPTVRRSRARSPVRSSAVTCPTRPTAWAGNRWAWPTPTSR